GRSIAFFYADNPPINVLSQFDRLVLEPDNIDASELPRLTAEGAAAFAYLSIGEVGPDRAYANEVEEEWVLGVNPAWNSQIFDLANTGLQDFVIERVAVLVQRGYQGIFLDTMDSFNLVAETDAEKSVQQAALVKLVRRIGTQFPELRIITNRGFEVIDQLADQVEAVAAESLYASWDNTNQRYGSVPANDRLWLVGKLDHVKHTLGLDVIAIDYVAPHERTKARAVARDIARHGYIPWVARPELDNIGVGALEVVPREVLLVFDSRIDGALEISALHRYVAAPLEYMGYIPVYIDRASDSLPAGELSGRYAGVTTWPVETYKDPELAVWLQKQLDDALPVAMFGTPPVAIDSLMAQSMGISVSGDIDIGSAEVSYSDNMIKPEIALPKRIDYVGLVSRSVASGNTTHMSYRDSVGTESDVTVTGPFGGFAWHPSTVQSALDYNSYWVVDPFQFLKKALQLPDTPMPDVTSENGKRLWIAHIDGDALPSWAEMPGRQLGAEVIYDRILNQYKLPHTVSVVEAEMTAFPAFFDRSKRMFDIARKTFKLDNVELASHTFSHPFKWELLGDYKKTGRYNLNVPGYEFSAEREVAGSIDFIDSTLAPEGKRTAAMLWSGDALPEEDALASAHRLGVPNMNGGFTRITRDAPSHTLVAPMARPVGDYLQVYAPIMNENIYTNDWQGPFDGFRQVIETFEMTESPRRLKPLNIYYHFYSGTKIASMRALEEVYEWSVTQDIHPLYVSEYANKVPDYRQAGVARYLDGRWKISRLGDIRSIRLLNKTRFPDLLSSEGISGVRSLHDGVYVHTDGRDSVSFKTNSTKPLGIHLVSSNGRVAEWDTKSGALEFRVVGNVPVNIELGGALVRTCTIQANNRLVRGKLTEQNTMSFTFTTRDTGNAILNCQA
ncbi:MAG: bifunctional glycoside hydrolase 114/ polysaccharide deacetylase family protein, partial [Granulosicoccus sp.]